MKRIRLLVVDDSAVARGIITKLLEPHSDVEVVGYCRDGRSVQSAIEKLKPDVITLDVEMPHLNGPGLLAQLQTTLKTPVVMVSGVTARGAQITLDCLALGAVDFVLKPSPKSPTSFETAIKVYGIELIEKIRIAAQSHPQVVRVDPTDRPSEHSIEADVVSDRFSSSAETSLIAIGASTGGPNAVANILKDLPADCPPIVVAIHMPIPFTRLYAERIDKLCKLKVVHAKNGEQLTPGTVYIAPGDQHITVIKRMNTATSKPSYSIRLVKPTRDDLIKPSIDKLFESVAKTAGQYALACVLTGMGKDGAIGSLVIHESGGTVFAQDEASSVIYGMPKAAKNEGHIDQQLDLKDFPKAISKYLQQTQKTSNGEHRHGYSS
jgi:two-component system, chemotaxis family, protein-glutamate methylesterase/glutaminase